MADMDEKTAQERAREKYQAILTGLWTVEPDECPICRTRLWNMGDMVEIPLRPQATGLHTGIEPRQAFLYMPVMCTNCGYTMFFNIGVLNEKPDPSEAS